MIVWMDLIQISLVCTSLKLYSMHSYLAKLSIHLLSTKFGFLFVHKRDLHVFGSIYTKNTQERLDL